MKYSCSRCRNTVKDGAIYQIRAKNNGIRECVVCSKCTSLFVHGLLSFNVIDHSVFCNFITTNAPKQTTLKL